MNLRFLLFIGILSFFPLLGLAQPGLGVDTNQVDYQVTKTYEIGGIKVYGNGAIKEAVVLARTGLRVGDQVDIPGEAVSNAIRQLWRTNLFSQVEISIDKIFGKIVFLRIDLQERPRLSRYFLRGIKHNEYYDLPSSEVEDLREKIRLVRGDPVTEYDKSRITTIIKRHYVEKGFLNTTVDFTMKDDTAATNSLIVYIDVRKGKKVKIEGIEFIGNEAVSDGKLRSIMKDTKQRTQFHLNPKTFFAPKDTSKAMGVFDALGNISRQNLSNFFEDKITFRLLNSSKFDQDKYEDDKRAVIDHYNSLGYRDARIIDDTIFSIDPTDIGIQITVEEGQRYYFRNIRWNGNQKYPDALLSAVLGIKKGDIYDQTRLEKRLYFDPNGNDVSSLYMDDGYLFFNVNPQEVRIIEDSIDIEIRVIEGPQATIDQVIIKGNDKTSEHVIRRELRTLPGQKFSRTALIRSQREIASLGFFDPEQIGIDPKPHPENGTVDIEYTVVEKPSDQIELSAGWGGQVGGLYGSAGIVFNNFSLRKLFDPQAWKRGIPAGDGQQLSFRLQSRGKYLQSYTFSFTEPWFGGKRPNSLSTSFNFTKYNPAGLSKDNEFASYITTRSVTVGYGLRMKWPDDYFYLTFSGTLENFFLKNYGQFVITDGNSNNLYLKTTVSRVSTDHPFYPSTGSNISFSAQLTPPYSLFRPDYDYNAASVNDKYRWVEYQKYRLNAEWYTTLAGAPQQGKRKLVLKAGAKFGFLGAYDKARTGIAPFERFRMGGDGLSGGFILQGYDIISLRGTENEFLPVGTPNGVNSEDAYNAPIFNKFTVELRYPFSLSQASTIYALAFVEGGNSYYDWESYDPFNLKRSAGLGLRLYLPMFGLLGFDYGIRIDQTQGKTLGQILNGGAFQFKLGFEPE